MSLALCACSPVTGLQLRTDVSPPTPPASCISTLLVNTGNSPGPHVITLNGFPSGLSPPVTWPRGPSRRSAAQREGRRNQPGGGARSKQPRGRQPDNPPTPAAKTRTVTRGGICARLRAGEDGCDRLLARLRLRSEVKLGPTATTPGSPASAARARGAAIVVLLKTLFPHREEGGAR